MWGLPVVFIDPLVAMAADYDSQPGLTVRYELNKTQEQTRVCCRAMRPKVARELGAGGDILPQAHTGLCSDSTTFMATGECETQNS